MKRNPEKNPPRPKKRTGKVRYLNPLGPRRKSRELCLQMLLQWDIGKQTPDQVRKTFWAERTEVDEETRGFAHDIFRLATERQAEIDELIHKHAQPSRMGRMTAVDHDVPPDR